MSEIFNFKKFSIDQSRCAMKVGTDAVILGAWTAVANKPESILDIGAGTGILALMLAQRTDAIKIDALEIDADSYEQCVENFENSDWSDRLFCYHASLEEFKDEIEDKYDLIVCNPPFFDRQLNLKMEDSRSKARFNDSMPFDELCASAAKLLSEDGNFSVIIPTSSKANFIAIASRFHLKPQRLLYIKGDAASPVKRTAIEFSFHSIMLKEKNLTIETQRHDYTKEYIALTKDFYIKM